MKLILFSIVKLNSLFFMYDTWYFRLQYLAENRTCYRIPNYIYTSSRPIRLLYCPMISMHTHGFKTMWLKLCIQIKPQRLRIHSDVFGLQLPSEVRNWRQASLLGNCRRQQIVINVMFNSTHIYVLCTWLELDMYLDYFRQLICVPYTKASFWILESHFNKVSQFPGQVWQFFAWMVSNCQGEKNWDWAAYTSVRF